MSDVRLDIHVDEVIRMIDDEAERRMTEAVNVVRMEAVLLTSQSGPGHAPPGLPPYRQTGFLSEHVIAMVATTRTQGAVIGKVGSVVHYAPWLEYPLNHRWLKPAFDNTSAEVEQIFSTEWF